VPFPKRVGNRMPAFVALLVGIVVSITLLPLFLPDAAHLAVGRLMMAAVLFLALWAAGMRPRTLLLFSPAFLAYVVALEVGGVSLGVLVIVIRAFFFGCATVLILWHVLREQKVTGDVIAGAACAYLLTGVTWANFYELLEVLRPGSFDIPSNFLLKPSGDPLFAFQYFSFTTLTTVGYGDIHPLGVRGGGLAIGEAVVGQLYVAIMIARLVGLQLVQRS
jgi:hypothetical protein